MLRAVSFVRGVILDGGRAGGFCMGSPWKGFPLVEECVVPTPETSALVAFVEDDCGDGKGEDSKESGKSWLVNLERV